MRLVAVDGVPAGSELARDVISGLATGPPLMRAGLTLTEPIIARAAGSGVSALWVNDDLGEGIVPPEPLAADLSILCLRAIARVHDGARLAFASDRGLDSHLLGEVADAADEIADEISVSSPALADPPPGDPHGHWHVLRVTTLGLMIGERHLRDVGWVDYTQTPRFDQIDVRLGMLGTGLLLHDIGRLGVAEAPTGSSESRSSLERQPELGAAVLPAGLVSAPARSVVRSHHERWDGGGYPDGRSGAAIHPFARIAAIAKAYDVLSCGSSDRGALPRHAAVRAIEEGAGTRFDPAVVALFRSLVSPYPLGHPVVLPDGRRGVVAGVDPDERLRPTVRVRDGVGALAELPVDMSAQFEAAGSLTPAANAA